MSTIRVDIPGLMQQLDAQIEASLLEGLNNRSSDLVKALVQEVMSPREGNPVRRAMKEAIKISVMNQVAAWIDANVGVIQTLVEEKIKTVLTPESIAETIGDQLKDLSIDLKLRVSKNTEGVKKKARDDYDQED